MRMRVMLAVAMGVVLAMSCAAPAFAAATATGAAAAVTATPAATETKAAAAPAANTDDLLAKVAKTEADMKTFEADMKMVSKAAGQAMTMTGHLAAQPVMKEGKRVGSLMNMKVKATAGEAGEMNILVVCDGDFLWSETTHPQMGIMVMKNKPDARQMQTGDSEEFRTKYNLKVVGEEEFDGQPMWVLEGTLKAPAAADKAAAPGASDPEKARLSIGKKDNYLHRVRGYDKTGAEVADMQMTNIKVNGALAPALFKYTPPADAKVMDMTKGMPSMGGAPKGE